MQFKPKSVSEPISKGVITSIEATMGSISSSFLTPLLKPCILDWWVNGVSRFE